MILPKEARPAIEPFEPVPHKGRTTSRPEELGDTGAGLPGAPAREVLCGRCDDRSGRLYSAPGLRCQHPKWGAVTGERGFVYAVVTAPHFVSLLRR